MHKAILHWVEMHRPWAFVLVALALLTDLALLSARLLEPRIEEVFEGPDESVCLRARESQSRSDIEACCAEGTWPTWSACEGTVAQRRALAALEAAHRLNQSRRERWEERGPSHYRYSFRFTCFACWGMGGFIFTSEVADGVPVLTVDGEGEFGHLPDTEFAQRYATMEGVFDAVDIAIDGQPFHSVEYSRRWGYPKAFSWGTIYVTDSTTQLEVIDFQALP